MPSAARFLDNRQGGPIFPGPIRAARHLVLVEADARQAERVERKAIRRARYERRMRRIDPQWGISMCRAAVGRTLGTPRVAALPDRQRWKPRHSLHDPGFTAAARGLLTQIFGLRPVPHTVFEPAEPSWLERLKLRVAQAYA